ncbi:TPA: acyltransferase family protein [Neisseria gonorrhoeae]|uniref:acyltransferase family protein n=1 Tax=Neisseria gonorrhoeae TaxID=485 RepID=UPI001F4E1CF1|nr:acyltransferase family protein [Neisseria gonorrhoeae]MCH8690607.1 acyltransferase [Neisseria gonorrhoeae]
MSQALPYRPDIDTLRAAAVLSVIVFHIEKDWLPGGFLGVDIFFVISGFLMTAILLREMSGGRFFLKTFYIRRIKRILPAFFAVLAATLAGGFFLFTKDDFFLLWKSALTALGFASNLYFARGKDYFDPAQEEKPLLHIWSLSVEEQFYFVFPILLLLVARKSLRVQFGFLAALCALSLAASFMPSALDKYYLPHLRACEMLVGSLTAVRMRYRQQRNPAVGALFSACILSACLFAYSEQTAYFPGPAALIPCLAVAALIYFNHYEHPLKKFFQWKITVAAGLISYSLYLWHWPILAFMRYIGPDNLPPYSPAAAIVLTLAFSLISYHCIEKPFKKWKGSFAQSVLWIYALPMLVLGAGSFFAMRLPFMAQYDRLGLTRSNTSCHNNTGKQCLWGDTEKQPELLVLGDSHADHYKTFFDAVGKKEKWSATMVSADACAYVEGYASRVFQNWAACRAVYRYAEEHLPRYPKVVLAMRWGSQMPENSRSLAYDAGFFQKFDRMLHKLSSEKQAVYLMADNLASSYNVQRAYILSSRIPGCRQTLRPDDESTLKANARIRELAAKYPNVYIIDAAAYIPADFQIGGLPVYSDKDHINPYGGTELAKRFSEKQRFLDTRHNH